MDALDYAAVTQNIYYWFNTDPAKQFIQRYLQHTFIMHTYQLDSFVSELRIWEHRCLIDVEKIKNVDFEGIHF